jgi:hypothetical protein
MVEDSLEDIRNGGIFTFGLAFYTYRVISYDLYALIL